MKKFTHEEWDRIGAAGVLRMVEEGKESIGLLNPKTGNVGIVLPYLPPTPPCDCEPELRHWVCLHCDGYVASAQQASTATPEQQTAAPKTGGEK